MMRAAELASFVGCGDHSTQCKAEANWGSWKDGSTNGDWGRATKVDAYSQLADRCVGVVQICPARYGLISVFLAVQVGLTSLPANESCSASAYTRRST